MSDDAKDAARREHAEAKALQDEIEANYRASLKVSPEAPTRFLSRLQKQVYASSRQFSMGQFCENDPSSDFLTTVAVLSCISVFAWAKKGLDGRPKGFGAHVNASAIHYGIRQQVWFGEKKHVLQELVDAMKKAFAGVTAGEVEVHLVGGHKFSDRDETNFKTKHPGSRPLMSWHILDAVRKAGFTKINQGMMNVFVGGPLGPSPLCEQRLVQDNQRLAVVTLHIKSGRIVTHSDWKSAEEEVPADMWSASQRMMATIPYTGKPLQHVDVKLVQAATPWYALLIAGLLLWYVTSMPYSLGFVTLLFFVLQPPSIVHVCIYVIAAALLFKCGRHWEIV